MRRRVAWLRGREDGEGLGEDLVELWIGWLVLGGVEKGDSHMAR